MTLRLPHPIVLLLGGLAVAAAVTWLLPAGDFDRRDDPATGRRLVVAGTYHAVPPTPASPFAAAVAIPEGFVDAADVIAVVLFVGGAWIVLDKLGTLNRLVGATASRFERRSLFAIPLVACAFASMGALENMQEEIIPLVPVLLAFGSRLGFDPVTVVAMSAGAAMIGSAFGPTNPFQAGIAMKLAQLPPLSSAGLRVSLFLASVAVWIAWTMWHARGSKIDATNAHAGEQTATGRDVATLFLMLLPMAIYIYGAAKWDWGFNQLSAGFILGGSLAGLAGGLGVGGTVAAYLEGMQAMLPAALLVGVARSISVVLGSGHVIDTILWHLSEPLQHLGPMWAALLMVPFHVLVHIAIPSVSGHAVLTMPLLVPLSDLVGAPRLAAVLAYETGAGLTELLTPTNGALMAILLAAGVPYQRWMRFALVGAALAGAIGVAGVLLAGA